MEKKRFIFDLDRTLLTCDYSKVEDELFDKVFGDQATRILNEIGTLLNEYEMLHSVYSEKALSEFLNERSGLEFNEDIIRSWSINMTESADTMEEDVVELLEHLKSKDKSLVVLTNWFGRAQIARLKNADIYKYFDDVFTGEYQLKPHRRAYLTAIGDYDPRECVMIGDNISKDYHAPKLHGIDAILYDKEDIHSDEFVKVKRLNEIIKRF